MLSTFLKRSIAIGLVGIAIIGILYNFGLVDKCPFKQIDVENDLKKYQITKDPLLCEKLNDKILSLDNECKMELEVIDCG